MFLTASVCLSVCQFVCEHDNFRTSKLRIMKLGGYMHSTNISPEFECQGQRSRSPGTKKNKKCGILFGSGPRGRGPLRRWKKQRTLSSYGRPME